MLLQRRTVRKLAPALETHVRLFASVRSHVRLQIADLVELSRAEAAAVRPRYEMHSPVPIQARLPLKSDRAHFAEEGPSVAVHRQMQLQLTRQRKRPIADGTRERPFAGVLPHVVVEPRASYEAAPADVTDVGPVSRVGRHVIRQVV